MRHPGPGIRLAPSGLLSRERDRLERLAKALLEQEQMDLQAVLAAI